MLSLVDTMLTDSSFEIITKGIPSTLTSLDLSKNENLTAKSYSLLHNLKSLRYLNVEQNCMEDECLSILLQIKQDELWKPKKLFNGL